MVLLLGSLTLVKLGGHFNQDFRVPGEVIAHDLSDAG
jgi:hypothetical protein